MGLGFERRGRTNKRTMKEKHPRRVGVDWPRSGTTAMRHDGAWLPARAKPEGGKWKNAIAAAYRDPREHEQSMATEFVVTSWSNDRTNPAA